MRLERTLAMSASALTLAAGLTACGSSASHNEADVEFATGMIPHHSQAVDMADMALQTTADPEVEALATDIKAAQDPEIQVMSGWLSDWDEPVPDPSDMDMSSGDMSGMMSDADMEQLGQSDGAKFDRLWLQMMIEHHRGAIEMADVEMSEGEYDDAQALAEDISDAQSSEIDTMEQLLTQQSG